MNWFGKIHRLIDYVSPIIPARWRLPLRYYAWKSSPNVEPELVYLFDLCKNFRCAIDIGANHGFYAYKMLQHFQHVYAFEANSGVDFDIQHYKKPNLHFFQFGLSNSNTEGVLNIPVQAGVAYEGWASLMERELNFADGFKHVPVKLERLDDQAFISAQTVDLIKIDVEGHEPEVLLGALETLRSQKPVLIIEKNENHQQVLDLLLPLGYRCSSFAQITGKQLPSPNVIFLPA